MSIHDIEELKAYKKSDVCVLLGSGTSINRITDEEWKWIGKQDSWAVNNWVYHPFFVPNFYCIEVKKYNYEIIQRRLIEKKEQYKNTNFIFPKNKQINMADGRVLRLRNVAGADNDVRIFEYRIVRVRDPRRTHKVFNADYGIPRLGCVKSYDMSMTVIFELLYKMKYRKIVTWGIDLCDSKYFWGSGGPIYGEVHHLWNKQHEGKAPTAPHATHSIKNFIVDFNERWFRNNKTELYVGHSDTDFYPQIPYISVGEEML